MTDQAQVVQEASDESGAPSRRRFQADAGRVYLTLRDSLYARVALMFPDPRCDERTLELVREYLTGRPEPATSAPT